MMFVCAKSAPPVLDYCWSFTERWKSDTYQPGRETKAKKKMQKKAYTKAIKFQIGKFLKFLVIVYKDPYAGAPETVFCLKVRNTGLQMFMKVVQHC